MYRYLLMSSCTFLVFQGLMLLESYTTLKGDALRENMPSFLNLGPDVTGDSAFSMFNLSLKEDWLTNDHFCHTLDAEKNNNVASAGHCKARAEAKERLEAVKCKK